MEKLLNVENDWDGELDCPEVMGPLLSHFRRRGCSTYQRIKNWKSSLSYWCDERDDEGIMAPKYTAYMWWSCHNGMINPVQMVSTPPAPSNGCPITVLGQAGGTDGWLAMLLIKASDVDTNPGPTTTRKQVWICNICHRRIQVRKQISIRCHRIEHWVHLRCAGICLAQYIDTWTCHQHREARHTTNNPTEPHTVTTTDIK